MAKVKLFPFYFPQFHSIPENDAWWGEGFTDWVRVKESVPLYQGHYQPFQPEAGFYNLSELGAVQNQVELALANGIDGFSFYHYWFDGKLLLGKPLENFRAKNHSLQFCLTWANETWTKRWIGQVNEVLIEQSHEENLTIWNEHLTYLVDNFTDSRYLVFDNKPVFIIYRPDLIPDIKKLHSYYNDFVRSNSSFDGIYWIGIKAYETLDNSWESIFNARIFFEPRYSMITTRKTVTSFVDKLLRTLPEKIQIPIGELFAKVNNKYTVYDYGTYSNTIIARMKKLAIESHIDTYQSIFTGWDNSPRYGNRAKIFENSSTNHFRKLVTNAVDFHSTLQNPVLFINAWNEWSEGAFLEPEVNLGMEKLDVLKQTKRSK